MIILREKKFMDRVRNLHSVVSKTPPSVESPYEIYQRTRRILEAHADGLLFLTLNRARLLRDGDQVTVDWDRARLEDLSETDIKTWAITVGRVTSNIRSVYSNVVLCSGLTLCLDNLMFLLFLCATFNLVQNKWKAPVSTLNLQFGRSTPFSSR